MSKVLRALIIENNGDITPLIGSQMKKSRMELESESLGTTSGLIETLSAQKWDIIISRYAPGDTNAIRALHISKEHAPGIPFIFISKEENEASAVEALRSGADDFISFHNISRLNETVKKLTAAKPAGTDKEPDGKADRADGSHGIAEHGRRHRALNGADSKTLTLEKTVEKLNQEIARRQKAEDMLRRREFVLTQAGRMAHLGAWDIDVSNTDNINANPLQWSDEVYRIFGYEPGEIEVSNQLFYKHVHPDDRQKVFDTFDTALESRQPYEIEHRIVRKDGSERIVLEYGEAQFDKNGNLTGIVGAVQDITERKIWEEQLKESTQRLKLSGERFRLALKYSPVAVFTQDRELRYTWIYQSVLDMPNSEFIGKSDYELFSTEDAAKLEEIKRYVIDTGQPRHDKVSVSKDGRELHFDMSVEPQIGESGEIEGIACAAVNITDMVQLEAEKKKQEVAQVIERSARLASIGVIAGGITHEINQPLNAIRMGAGGILFWNKRNKNVLPEVLVEMMTGIDDAVTRIDEIVKSMRALWANTGKETLEDVNINDSIEKVVSFNTQKLRNHGITVKVNLHPENLLIRVNALRLELVLSNLLTNAIHALDESNKQKKILEISSDKGEKKAIIEISDNGPGLPDVPLEKLFDPFFTTKGPEEGSGLGLAIVKMFLDKYGASLDVFNNKMGGATFSMGFNMIKPRQI